MLNPTAASWSPEDPNHNGIGSAKLDTRPISSPALEAMLPEMIFFFLILPREVEYYHFATPPMVRLASLLLLLHIANACTNFMVSPGASADGATIMSYSCDGPSFAALTHYPARAPPSKRQLKRKGCAEEVV